MLSVSAQDSTLFIQDEQTEKMNIEQQVGESKSLSNYSLSYSEPVYSMEQNSNCHIQQHLKQWILPLIDFAVT